MNSTPTELFFTCVSQSREKINSSHVSKSFKEFFPTLSQKYTKPFKEGKEQFTLEQLEELMNTHKDTSNTSNNNNNNNNKTNPYHDVMSVRLNLFFIHV